MKKINKQQIIAQNKNTERNSVTLGHQFTLIPVKQIRGIETLTLGKCKDCRCDYIDLHANDEYSEYFTSKPDGRYSGLTCTEVQIKNLLE